ncbi:uncharacterized protein LOC114336138 isoform X1 [Diabrotica virgifera virgifera]|nr:uncharacterized protein LOC114336138 isoform X1 [Diabrotica virgifera virgifera]XP_050508342.1 uncharacterized protein LOC114336138 isoform X1 [Diabrotica virgifera virgifera]
MAKHVKPQYTVTFNDAKEYIFSSESGEISNSEGDLSQEEKTTPNNLTKSSSAAGIGCEAGDVQSASSISTSILDDGDEVKLLKNKIIELENRNKLLDLEVEKVNLCLINERNKTTKLEKKLQFVKDNQDVFIKLKEAYINMKYNEAAGRKMVEIREKSVQTWEGILCRNCIDAEQLRRQLESVQKTYKDSFIVTPLQLEQLLSTLKYLKELIDRREKTWDEMAERDDKLQAQFQHLAHENSSLREILQIRRQSLPAEGSRVEDDNDIDELAMYKKIIIKYEKKLRESVQGNNGTINVNVPFNNKEKKLIQSLMARYFSKKFDKSQDKQNYCNIPRNATKETTLKNLIKTRTGVHQHHIIPKESLTKNDHHELGDNTFRVMNYFLESGEKGDAYDNSSRLSL